MALNYPKPRACLQTLTPYTPGQSQESLSADQDYLKLSSNENPLGAAVPPSELATLLNQIERYPAIATHPLTTALATHHGVSPSHILLGNGSDDCFLLLAQAYLNPGDEVLSAAHTFSVYKSVTLTMTAHYKGIAMHHYATDLDAILAAITAKTTLIFLANPNNPTGTFFNRARFTSFLEQVPSRVLVVLDEAYKDYVLSEPTDSMLPLLESYPNLVITRTFSKLYGLAGLRLGYAIGSPDCIAACNRVRPPFNVNRLSLDAGVRALTKQDFVTHTQRTNQSGLQQFYDALSSQPITLLPSEANFICVLFPTLTAKAVYTHFLNHGIIIRPLDSFGLPNGCRITVGTQAQNARCIDVLLAIIK